MNGRGTMQHDAYCEAIRREGHALGVGAGQAGIDAPVPSCPEWTVADLLSHVGRIHRWITGIVTDRRETIQDHWSHAEPPPSDQRLEWFTAGVDPLADALLSAGPDVEMWTWTDDHSSGFWARRQANETAVHRWDAELAAGAPAPLERSLAVDGIDEFLMLLPTWRGVEALRGVTGTLHLHCTDADGEWLARLGDSIEVTREHAKGDVAARGAASDLMLLIMDRVDLSAIDVFGDRELLQTFVERTRW
jgi:uncharacterized protein (TIGR03083 family)